jgi:transposase-like protein
LREHEKLQAQGLTIPQACKKIGISDQTFYRWRTKYGALKEDEAHRLKALGTENARLKRIVAEQALDISMLKDLNKEMVSPSRRRDAVTYLCRRHPVSERRACKLVGQYRSTQPPPGPRRRRRYCFCCKARFRYARRCRYLRWP